MAGAGVRPVDDSATAPHIAVLGPVRVTRGGALVTIGARTDRVVLGALALHAGRLVHTDTLVQLTYGDDEPPSGGRRGVQTAVWRLRQRFGIATIETVGDAYLLDPARCEIDVVEFDGALTAGRTAASKGDWTTAAEQLGTALSLWRGPALAEAVVGAAELPEVRRLAELRLGVIEDRAEALIRSQREHEGIAALEGLVVVEAGREHAWRLLADAWASIGRTTEAQRALDRARAALAEVGLTPGIELRAAATATAPLSARTAYLAMARFLGDRPGVSAAALLDAAGEPADAALWSAWLAALEAAGRDGQ